jgi:hypothetical protein
VMPSGCCMRCCCLRTYSCCSTRLGAGCGQDSCHPPSRQMLLPPGITAAAWHGMHELACCWLAAAGCATSCWVGAGTPDQAAAPATQQRHGTVRTSPWQYKRELQAGVAVCQPCMCHTAPCCAHAYFADSSAAGWHRHAIVLQPGDQYYLVLQAGSRPGLKLCSKLCGILF